MEIFKEIDAYRAWRSSRPPSETVGFVPTMGALHQGHLKLVETSRESTTHSVVSIFVNPLQFGPSEDFSRYPRPFEEDVRLCTEAGVSALFIPDAAHFYATDHSTYCEVQGLDQHLCGATRPGHFRGVCTVVVKLFNIIQPHMTFFGQKDIQQALILKKMTRDLSLNLDFRIVPTVREDSGLALSSRNHYLSPDEKNAARSLFQGLAKAHAAFVKGEKSSSNLIAIVEQEILASSPTRIDYIQIVSQHLLQPVDSIQVPSVMAVAVYYGKTRLIDNFLVNP